MIEVTEVTIESIRVSLMNYNRVVVLREPESNRYLPIYIGAPEADAIAMRLQGVSVARPMTHDLLATVLQELGGVVQRVVVSNLSNATFFAQLYVRVDERELEIDARPSDALALAVRSEVPIFVAQAVLEEAGVTLDGLHRGRGTARAGARAAPPSSRRNSRRCRPSPTSSRASIWTISTSASGVRGRRRAPPRVSPASLPAPDGL